MRILVFLALLQIKALAVASCLHSVCVFVFMSLIRCICVCVIKCKFCNL